MKKPNSHQANTFTPTQKPGSSSPAGSAGIALRLGFVLLPQFVMGGFAPFADLLAALDAAADKPGPCAWQVLAENLLPVRSASGIQVVPTAIIGTVDVQDLDCLVVVGGAQRPACAPGLDGLLRAAAAAGCKIVAIASGIFTLARAGVLHGYQACVPGSLYQEFCREFPEYAPQRVVIDRQSVFDGARISCAGGPAVLDVALQILAASLDHAEVQRALRVLQYPDTSGQRFIQPAPAELAPAGPALLRRAALLLQQYAGQGLTMAQLGARLGLSPRQLQRLFRTHLNTTPQAYARAQRLQLVDWLLRHSDKSLAAIASDCGYADAAHMSREFSRAHGHAPGAWRKTQQESVLSTPTKNNV